MSDVAPTQSRWRQRVIGPFTLAHVAGLVAVLAVTALLLALLTTPVDDAGQARLPQPGSGFYQISEPTTGLAVGLLAPELSVERDGEPAPLLDLDGEPISLQALRGRPVWVNFFASWCPPCQEETPVLRDMHARYADDGLALVAVSVQETTAADVAAYAERYDLDYTIGFDGTSEVFRTYQGFGLPTHVFIDADGVIQHLRYGPLDRETAIDIIEPLLEGALG